MPKPQSTTFQITSSQFKSALQSMHLFCWIQQTIRLSSGICGVSMSSKLCSTGQGRLKFCLILQTFHLSKSKWWPSPSWGWSKAPFETWATPGTHSAAPASWRTTSTSTCSSKWSTTTPRKCASSFTLRYPACSPTCTTSCSSKTSSPRAPSRCTTRKPRVTRIWFWTLKPSSTSNSYRLPPPTTSKAPSWTSSISVVRHLGSGWWGVGCVRPRQTEWLLIRGWMLSRI